MDNKSLYRQFCEKQTDLPIFMQDWFLDAVCEWEVVLSFKGEKIVGVFPYPIQKKFGLQFSLTPMLCMNVGAFIIQEYRNLDGQHEILRNLTSKLPKFAYFNHKFHYSISNWLPFYWQGFKQTTRYTYILDDLSDLENVYKKFCSDYRNIKIPKATANLDIKTDLSLEIFYKIQKLTYDRQQIGVPFSYPYLEKIHNILQEKKQGQLFFAVNKEGLVCSVLYLIWDKTRAYAWLSGDDPTYRNEHAGVLTYWKSIEYTAKELKLPIYDFEGSMIQGVEKARRNFGAKQVSYFQIYKYQNTFIKWGLRMLGKGD